MSARAGPQEVQPHQTEQAPPEAEDEVLVTREMRGERNQCVELIPQVTRMKHGAYWRLEYDAVGEECTEFFSSKT